MTRAAAELARLSGAPVWWRLKGAVEEGSIVNLLGGTAVVVAGARRFFVSVEVLMERELGV